MRFVLCFLTVICLLSVSPAFSEENTGRFSGPYASLGAGYQYSDIFHENVRTVNPIMGLYRSYDQPSASGEDVLGQALAGYGYNFGQNYNLSINLFYNFGATGVADIKATFYQDTVKQRIKNTVGMFLAPGYYISPQALVFLKVGYVRSGQEYIRDSQNIRLDRTIQGFLWGVGAKYLVSENVFIGVDVTRYTYGKSSDTTRLNYFPFVDVDVSSKVEQTSGVVSIGYQF